MFLNSTRPIDLHRIPIRLGPHGSAAASTWPELTNGASPGVRAVAAFRAADDADLHPDVWERHPDGQEVLCVLIGAIDVYLRDIGEPDEPFARVGAGQSFIVPTGHWHRLALVATAELLTITPPAGTEHEPVAGRSEQVEEGRDV